MRVVHTIETLDQARREYSDRETKAKLVRAPIHDARDRHLSSANHWMRKSRSLHSRRPSRTGQSLTLARAGELVAVGGVRHDLAAFRVCDTNNVDPSKRSP